MIEKFSEEELKIIKKELGLYETTTKKIICRKQIKRAKELLEGKIEKTRYGNWGVGELIYNIIDITLANVYERNSKYGTKKILSFCQSIHPEDAEEYTEMFDEILDIVEKHNRPWEG